MLRPENIVHQTMRISNNSAPKASRKISNMTKTFAVARAALSSALTFGGLAIVGALLVACGGPRPAPEENESRRITYEPAPVVPPSSSIDLEASGADPSAPPVSGVVVQQARSRWTPVAWSELPGWEKDKLDEAWTAWLRSCEKPPAPLAALCGEVHRLGDQDDVARRAWMERRLQPYRVENLRGEAGGLLTGYYEPVVEASRVPDERFKVPLHRPPANLKRPWYTRQEMDTLPAAQAALRGREIAWLADPVAALNLQIQGSGRLLVTEPDGSRRTVRVGYAGTNDQPYRSVGLWLRERGEVTDASWPSIRQWVAANPRRVQEMLWANPRVTFFQEQSVSGDDSVGPRGAQGVPLTAGRSIAVDPQSIPYGAPVWLASPGPLLSLQRLVMAQDTGSAIVGAVRADYFVGTGDQASAIAGRLKQPLRLWVLWPK